MIGRFLLAGAAGVLGLAAGAWADPIYSVQLAPNNGGHQGTPLTSTQVAGVVPASNYNVFTSVGGTSGTLADNTGSTATGVTLSYAANDAWVTATDTSTSNGALLSGESKAKNGTSTYTLGNLPAGTYSLYAYIENDVADPANYTVGSTTYYVTDQATTGTPAFLQASNTDPNGTRDTGNYVEFTPITVAAGGSIVLSIANGPGGSGTAALNGLQLVDLSAVTPLPAAASGGILLLGGLALSRLRRRVTV